MALHEDIIRLIIQYALLLDPKTVKSLKLTCRLFNCIASSTASTAALFFGLYGPSMCYHKLLTKNPQNFQINMIKCIQELSENSRLPSSIARAYQQGIYNNKTLSYIIQFVSKGSYESEDVELLNLFKQYDLELSVEERMKSIHRIKRFLNDSLFVPEMSSKRGIIIEKLPINLLLDDVNVARYILDSSGIDAEHINTAMTTRIYWELGVMQYSDNINSKINKILEIGQFSVDMDSVKEIIRRSSWIDRSQMLKSLFNDDILDLAVKQVIKEYLGTEHGVDMARYQCAVRLAQNFNIPFDFVSINWKTGMGSLISN